MSNTYVDSAVLPVWHRFTIDGLDVQVIESGLRERGGCTCHPQWYDVFRAEVVSGPTRGTIVRGYTDTFDGYDPTADEEYVSICAFLLDEVTS